MDEWVFVDTCMWASFFTKPASPAKLAIDKLIDAGKVALVGPIIAEVLIGFRRKNQADWSASRLKYAEYAEVEWEDWQEAANLGRKLIAAGHKLPLTDLVIAVVAQRLNAYVYTTDPHFDLIQNLKRYVP